MELFFLVVGLYDDEQSYCPISWTYFVQFLDFEYAWIIPLKFGGTFFDVPEVQKSPTISPSLTYFLFSLTLFIRTYFLFSLTLFIRTYFLFSLTLFIRTYFLFSLNLFIRTYFLLGLTLFIRTYFLLGLTGTLFIRTYFFFRISTPSTRLGIIEPWNHKSHCRPITA